MSVGIQGVGVSPNGEYLAVCSPEGCLDIWETFTGAFHQQYSPSSHLSAACKCLCWEPQNTTNGSVGKSKQKKRKSSLSSGQNLVALGSSGGGILVYSVAKGLLQCTLPSFHRKKVNGLSWCPQNKLYSCSNDGYIAEWSVSNGTLLRKWVGDENAVYSVQIASEKTLISGSRSIKLWDLTSLKVLKVFPGHSNEVRKLLPVPSSCNEDFSNYFLSVAENEKFINVWNKQSQETVDAVAKLNCKEEIISTDIKEASHKPNTIIISAVTQNGMLNIFEHVFNGPKTKPIAPNYVVQISSEAISNGETYLPINIISAHIESSGILICYGSLEEPKFERITFQKLEPKLILTRSLESKHSQLIGKNHIKVNTPIIDETTNYLGPSLMTPKIAKAGSNRKRRTSSCKANLLPMEERLDALALEKCEDGSKPLPRSDNLTNLLIQGLQSHDIRILQSVIQCSDELTIQNTVKRLPIQFILPLIDNLKFYIQGRGHVNQSHIKWIRVLLQVHASYLMSCNDACDSLGPLYQMIDARSDVFKRLTQLKGRLDLLTSQVFSKHEEAAKVNNTPLLSFEDEATDEDSEVLNSLMMPNESDDSWEELSDADENSMEVQNYDSSEDPMEDSCEDT